MILNCENKEKEASKLKIIASYKEELSSLQKELENNLVYKEFVKLSPSTQNLIVKPLQEVYDWEKLCNEGYPATTVRNQILDSLGPNASFLQNYGIDETMEVINKVAKIKEIEELLSPTKPKKSLSRNER